MKKGVKLKSLKRNFFLLFSAYTEKRVKARCSFTVCPIVTLKDVGFTCQLNCQFKLSTKPEKKLVTDVLKDSKTSRERIRVAHNAFQRITISTGTVRRILKK